jgi:K+-sensing histidine kinase KdpD
MSQAPTDPRWPKILSLSVHEFRTPMTVVAGYIRMLLKDRAGPLSDQQRRLLEEAEKSCARLSALLAELSDVSHLEGGQAPFNKGRADLNALLRDAVAQLPPLSDRQIAVTLDVPEAAAPIDADAVRLTQAFSAVIAALRRELISDGPLIVRGRTMPSGGHLVLIGEPPTVEALEKEGPEPGPVFDEWRGGVGLSLAVARRVLDGHGAAIYAPATGAKSGARVVFAPPA